MVLQEVANQKESLQLLERLGMDQDEIEMLARIDPTALPHTAVRDVMRITLNKFVVENGLTPRRETKVAPVPIATSEERDAERHLMLGSRKTLGRALCFALKENRRFRYAMWRAVGRLDGEFGDDADVETQMKLERKGMKVARQTLLDALSHSLTSDTPLEVMALQAQALAPMRLEIRARQIR